MDRVSNLPDEVLSHILSFLTTKEAALTSILAKRWRNLFALVPNLAIDDSVFLHPEVGKENREDIIQSFMNFVDRVLAVRGDSPVKKVSIECVSKVDSDRVDGWISNVLAHGVSDLKLVIILNRNGDENYQLSPKCFECSTLIKLKIGVGIDIHWDAGCICSPLLKNFVLDTAGVNAENFETLLHALPALEELVLDNVLWEGTDLNVSSASLKILKIDANDGFSTLSLDTPSLTFFEYFGYTALDYPVVNMENLIDARVMFSLAREQVKQVREPDNDWFDNRVVVACSNAWKLFHGIQNVPYLELSPDTHEVLSLCWDSMPVFNNLKVLHIKSAEDRGWQGMPALLSNCPKLETLIIEGLIHYVTDMCGDACDCMPWEDKGLSLTHCPVKALKIEGFRGAMKEMRMIKHFLDYLPNLMRFEVFVAENNPTQFGNPEISDLIEEIFKLYNEISSCNVQLLVSDALSEKWGINNNNLIV